MAFVKMQFMYLEILYYECLALFDLNLACFLKRAILILYYFKKPMFQNFDIFMY